ncbi:hypothetical protein NDU88_003809 [Pleurodeles waltl]|uniref:Uncharacterized protein n=1 Tax=Pleurodeles waltl TaxID=8319 RepID=A0AAV7KZ42_PLEWA|nr:hypothetical protein NDU88_003809 [Pleurodeles waltl]
MSHRSWLPPESGRAPLYSDNLCVTHRYRALGVFTAAAVRIPIPESATQLPVAQSLSPSRESHCVSVGPSGPSEPSPGAKGSLYPQPSPSLRCGRGPPGHQLVFLLPAGRRVLVGMPEGVPCEQGTPIPNLCGRQRRRESQSAITARSPDGQLSLCLIQFPVHLGAVAPLASAAIIRG